VHYNLYTLNIIYIVWMWPPFQISHRAPKKSGTALITAGPEGVRRVRPHRAPKNRGPSGHWTLALFPLSISTLDINTQERCTIDQFRLDC
jgi:hypothetical protein